MQMGHQPVGDEFRGIFTQHFAKLWLIPQQTKGERYRICRMAATRFGQSKPFFEYPCLGVLVDYCPFHRARNIAASNPMCTCFCHNHIRRCGNHATL